VRDLLWDHLAEWLRSPLCPEAAPLPRRRDRRPEPAGGAGRAGSGPGGRADTVNRELSIAHKAIGWRQRQGWIEGDPTIGIERRPAPPDRTKALAENQIAALPIPSRRGDLSSGQLHSVS
jgi:hypothetical protein